MSLTSVRATGLLFLLLFLVVNSEFLQSEVYHIKTSPSDPCLEEPCLTLQEFNDNSSSYLVPNTTLIFLPGEHVLESELLIGNISIFSMISNISTTIICNLSASARIELDNIRNVHISEMMFSFCAGNIAKFIEQFTIVDSSFIYHVNTALELFETSATLTRSVFYFNMLGKLQDFGEFSRRYGFIYNSLLGGGAVVSKRSNVYIIDCWFEANSAQVGGSLFSDLQSNVTIISTLFRDNNAPLNVDLHQYGVLLSQNGGSLSVSDCVFINNSALNNGIVYAINKVYLTVHQSSFINNSVYVTYDESGNIIRGTLVAININISNCEFINNSVYHHDMIDHYYHAYFLPDGAIVSGAGANMALSNSIFVNNHAYTIQSNSPIGTAGTALAIVSTWGARSLSIITHCQFIDNYGVILTVYGLENVGFRLVRSISIDIVITECEFISDATSRGQLLILDGSNTTMNRSKFRDNTGDCISIYGGLLTISNCLFDHNSGRVLYVEVIAMSISESVFRNNRVNTSGGVMILHRSKSVIDGCKFYNSTAHNNGGVVEVKYGNLTVHKSSFESNSAKHDGGVIVLVNGNVTIHQSMFDSNSADNNGGVIDSQQGSIGLYDSSFENNSADYLGGIIASKSGFITVHRGSFIGNMGNNGGVFQLSEGTITISASAYYTNKATSDGGVIYVYQSTISILQCSFHHNNAENNGGIISAYLGHLLISHNTVFNHNRANNDGGLIHANGLDITVQECRCNASVALNQGGLCFITGGNLNISQSILSDSVAADGGTVYANHGNITMKDTICVGSKADIGGVLHTDTGILSINNCSFNNNTVKNIGGAWLLEKTKVSLKKINIISNHAKNGAAVYSRQSEINSYGSLFISCNKADTGVFYLLESSACFYGEDTVFIDNYGSCLLLNSTAIFKGTTNFLNCSEPERSLGATEMQEGGGLTIVRSYIIFEGAIIFTNNHAQNGGAMYVKESKVYVSGETTIANNTADNAGGGVYLYVSELCCMMNSSLKLMGNKAGGKGGGVRAFNSAINITRRSIQDSIDNPGYPIYFSENEAKKGGGLFLDMNAQLNIFLCTRHSGSFTIVSFIANIANYGGAVYVSDDTATCSFANTPHHQARKCFVWVSASHSNCSHKGKVIFFSQNYAHVQGSSLFTGVVDHCSIHQPPNFNSSSNEWYELHDILVLNETSYINSISNINLMDVSSPPVQLCFCKHYRPVCDYPSDLITVSKGQNVATEVVALDQLNHPINATVNSYLLRTGEGLGKGQSIQNLTKGCSKLNFNIFSPNPKEELIMHTEVPCVRSQLSVVIHFSSCDSCPVGFQKAIKCKCICDTRLQPYITQCNASTGVLVRKGNFWITYINNIYSNDSTSGYLIYPNCPLNYCLKSTLRVEINLNIPSGADAQCVNGRSGMLCGTCQSNLSLSLGSSFCMPCSSNRRLAVTILIILSVFLAGIALVALLLVLNLTVAVGTINGIIFYANIVVAVKSEKFLQFSKPNLATVFVSWLNFEIGFDVCFFEGVDAYWKTLLQLTFPLYTVFLATMVIATSRYSIRFSRLVAKKNPVATLATLILLSYTKFLNTVISSLSYATLVYPDGSHRKVWLPDANIEYLKGKHIVLFIIGIVILLAGVVYTTLLFSWQWLLYHQDKVIFKWTKYQPLCHFLEPYHAPYTIEQRYWTGLLLLVRVVIYTVSALNETGDPRVSFVAINILVGLLPLVKNVLERKIYKQKLVDIMEMITYFNLFSFAVFTWYTYDASKNQAAIAYISVMITFCLLLAVCVFHIFRYTTLYSYIIIFRNKLMKHKTRSQTGQYQVSLNKELNQPLVTHSVVGLSFSGSEENSEEVDTRSHQDSLI